MHELEGAFERMAADDVDAVFVLPDIMLSASASVIAELALKHRLPTMTWGSWFADAGCLMAYSADYGQMSRRLAFYVDRILNGADPGDLPIEQPTTLSLSINLKTAGELGVEPPESLLLLADRIIE
jgi:putative ABC transport system substrate-binding protein